MASTVSNGNDRSEKWQRPFTKGKLAAAFQWYGLLFLLLLKERHGQQQMTLQAAQQYNAAVARLPYTYYGIAVWDQAAQVYLKKVFILKKRALRLMFFAGNRSFVCLC